MGAELETVALSMYRFGLYTSGVLPHLLLAERIFRGKASLADVTFAAGHFQEIVKMIYTLVSELERFNKMSGAGLRLDELECAFDELDQDYKSAERTRANLRASIDSARSSEEGSGAIYFKDFSLTTPGSNHKLVQELNLTVQPGSSVIIMGPSGVGKSSLLRAICGLWTPSNGSIKMPNHVEPISFLRAPTFQTSL